jgi:hypothetical protein
MPDIQISPDVMAQIWKCWQEGDRDENDIIARLLSVPPRALLGPHTPSAPRRWYRWMDDIKTALNDLGGEAELADIYQRVRMIRSEAGRSIPTNFDVTVRTCIRTHSSDSKNFMHREDCFQRVRDGRWRLRTIYLAQHHPASKIV